MIEDLRFIEREDSEPCGMSRDGMQIYRIIKIKVLQAYDGHVWYDVPLIEEEQSVPK